jgi:hypothetical protein
MPRLTALVRAWLASLIHPTEGGVGRCVAGAAARPPR